MSGVDERPEAKALLESIRASLPELERLLERCTDHWTYEDFVYRFYHQSFKVYGLQQTTREVALALQAIRPDQVLNDWFRQIVEAGLGRSFQNEDNQRWLEATRPILEAFFHAKFFLEMAVRYGRTLDEPPLPLPSGWAALLYLYNLR